MGKMQDEIKALRRQNTHLQTIVQRQRERLAVVDKYRHALDAHYAACAIQFGEKREDCDVLWGYHLEIPAELVEKGKTYWVKYGFDPKRNMYIIGAYPKE